jgi:hypothetical protein
MLLSPACTKLGEAYSLAPPPPSGVSLVCLSACRLYVPRVQDKEANMHFLHLDAWDALQAVPPFGIREPRPTYDDGSDREDVLMVGGWLAG